MPSPRCPLSPAPPTFSPGRENSTSHLLGTTLPATSLSVEIWSHLDATLALALVGSLSPNLASLFESIIVDHPSRAARTLWLKLEADYGTRSSYDLWNIAAATCSLAVCSLAVCSNPTGLDNFVKAYRSVLDAFAAEVNDGAPSPYEITRIEFGINVQHDFITVGCTTNDQKAIRQERQITANHTQAVRHLEFRSKVFMFANRGSDYAGETFPPGSDLGELVVPAILDGTGHLRRPWPKVVVRGPSLDPLSEDEEAHYEASFHSLQYLPDDVPSSVDFNIENCATPTVPRKTWRSLTAVPKSARKKGPQKAAEFLPSHPQFGTHRIQTRRTPVVPILSGPTIPRDSPASEEEHARTWGIHLVPKSVSGRNNFPERHGCPPA
ncbi:hypothetical protein I350_01908 [Cryptococcus amylolentus CBS 6273]|uniref:Uncharacterized protein n=1 Tax=Cryptococcus amylolentus CBS 6273 TaxID=1296118 RepID=A0A1E3K932_9TREE|nr:hypothetical protein I350_01908 [Cryptococcus amylolentus CBS 6273]